MPGQRFRYTPAMIASTATFDRLVDSVGGELTQDFARRLVNLRPDPLVEARLEELADRSTAGTLTEAERGEYESLVILGDLIAILQKRSRAMLGHGLNGE